MALTTGRAVALALVATAAVAVLLLPPRPGRLERSGSYVRNAAYQARVELGSARRAVAARVARDSAARHPLGSPIVFLGAWDDSARSWISRRIEERVGAAAATDPRRLRIVFARDTAFSWGGRLLFALPAQPGDPCVAIYGERLYSAAQRQAFRRAITGLPGPCAYYAEFGQPGTAVDRWLRDGGTSLALARPGQPATTVPVPARRSWLATLIAGGETPRFADQRLPAQLALESCIAGRLEFCAQFARGPREGDRRLTVIGMWEEMLWASTGVEATWLSDVLRAFGEERFAAFWTADGDFDGAFATAFGAPVGEWTHSWIMARFDGRPNGRSLPARAGLSLLSAAVLLGVAVVIANRRRAG